MREGVIDNKMHLIGNIPVFTYQKAAEVYKLFVENCYKDLTVESSIVLGDVADDMIKIGFSHAELESMETEVITKKEM